MEHKVFTQPKKRQSFNIMRENAIIEDLTPKLPEDESFVYYIRRVQLDCLYRLDCRSDAHKESVCVNAARRCSAGADA